MRPNWLLKAERAPVRSFTVLLFTALAALFDSAMEAAVMANTRRANTACSKVWLTADGQSTRRGTAKLVH